MGPISNHRIMAKSVIRGDGFFRRLFPKSNGKTPKMKENSEVLWVKAYIISWL